MMNNLDYPLRVSENKLPYFVSVFRENNGWNRK